MDKSVVLGSIVVAVIALVIALALVFGPKQRLRDVEEFRSRRRQRRRQWLEQFQALEEPEAAAMEAAEKWYQDSFKARIPEARTNALLRSLYNQNAEIITLLRKQEEFGRTTQDQHAEMVALLKQIAGKSG